MPAPPDSTSPAAPPSRSGDYTVGVMTMEAEGRDSETFRRRVAAASKVVDDVLTKALGVRVVLHSFEGPHLTPSAGAYAPLDFLQIGMSEKVERGVHFLLVVTEVDLAASTLSYTLALPSQLTNVAVVSTKRLDPGFWGDDLEASDDVTVRRLTGLLLHSFGHLLNLDHDPDPSNAMFDVEAVEDLDRIGGFSEAQRDAMRRVLPREAHERTTRARGLGRLRFVMSTVARDALSIGAAVRRANPFSLVTQLPTMITAALSVLIFLLFTPDMWDVASTVDLYQIVGFSVAAVVASTVVLYRAFALGGGMGRGRVVTESSVVTAVATALCLVLTMLLLFAGFALLTYLGVVTIFPRKLMETWPTVDPAIEVLDHVKLSLFVAALGLLAGSLGGRADSKDLVRAVLFVDEET